MSKRKTISHGERFHFFKEDDDTESVFIEIEDIKECSFELWQLSDDKQMSRAVVKIPVEFWKKMVEDWINRPNGQTDDQKVATFD